jgi:hypothetical protein
MPTVKEENAGFDAAHTRLLQELAAHNFMFKDQVIAKFESKEGRQMLLNVVRVTLDAAEAARK